MKRALIITAVAVAGLAVAAPVVAQQFGPGEGRGPGMHRMHGGMMGGGPMNFGRMCENQDARLAGMLAYAEKRLKITDAQKPAWTKLATAAQDSQKPLEALCAKYKDQPLPTTLPDRLERMGDMMSARVTQFQQLRPLVVDLYNQLSPEQKKVADAFMQHRGRGFGPGGMGGGMGGMGGGPGGPGFGPGGQGGPGQGAGPRGG
ncbi:MAG TPA: Spy/CpxP family protein refolding chaperone [Azospirillum sp.]|nr:Spy/CpxP family protein refolding chaperone [Azospirillum sp.]